MFFALFHVCSILFIPCFLFVLFLFLVVSGKLKFYWPSSSHRITVTGTSPPLPIHPLPSPPTTQLPSFTCYWQDTSNRINSAWSLGNLMTKRKVMGLQFFCLFLYDVSNQILMSPFLSDCMGRTSKCAKKSCLVKSFSFLMGIYYFGIFYSLIITYHMYVTQDVKSNWY